jgi:hypothetical protein
MRVVRSRRSERGFLRFKSNSDPRNAPTYGGDKTISPSFASDSDATIHVRLFDRIDTRSALLLRGSETRAGYRSSGGANTSSL